jgi:hypothetical protein
VANAKRLLDVLTFLEAHPDRHDQSVWLSRDTCGTVACLAGWTCLRNGYVEVVMKDEALETVVVGIYADSDPEKVVVPASAAARDLLELDDDEGDELFSGNNSLEDLWRIADELTDYEVSRLFAEGSVSS